MKRTRFTDEQIIGIMAEDEAGGKWAGYRLEALEVQGEGVGVGVAKHPPRIRNVKGAGVRAAWNEAALVPEIGAHCHAPNTDWALRLRSSSSAAGSESRTMAPPAPMVTSPTARTAVRMTTLRSD